jgi:hypothetical protein
MNGSIVIADQNILAGKRMASSICAHYNRNLLLQSDPPISRTLLLRDPPYFAVFEGQIFPTFRLFWGTFVTSNMGFVVQWSIISSHDYNPAIIIQPLRAFKPFFG